MERYCGENLTEIGAALKTYAEDHQGHFPDSLETLEACADR